MEAISVVAGHPWSDHDEDVSPVIGALLRSWNDSLPTDEDRTRLLRPLILPALNTRCDAATDARLAWMAVDWLVRVQAPAWMRLTMSLRAHGEALAGLPEITVSSWPSAKLTVAAAGDAAWAAAWAAAGDAAWDAAGDAAWDAAWGAARAAAGDAAGAAAGDAAGAAAGDAARAAAGDAAGDALDTTVRELQESAVALVLRMCRVAKGEEPA